MRKSQGEPENADSLCAHAPAMHSAATRARFRLRTVRDILLEIYSSELGKTHSENSILLPTTANQYRLFLAWSRK